MSIAPHRPDPTADSLDDVSTASSSPCNDACQSSPSARKSTADEPALSSTKLSADNPRRGTGNATAVPQTSELREQIKQAAFQYVDRLGRPTQFSKADLAQFGRELLEELRLPEMYLGFTMVLIANALWRGRFASIPFERRVLLLPHSLKHADGCPAEYDEFGLDCERCGACSIADYKLRAEQLGYEVLIAEGSAALLKIIVSGRIDGILVVAGLNSLERAIDKVLVAGVPCCAIPLRSADGENTSLDETWVWEVIDQFQPSPVEHAHSYVPLLRASAALFEESFDRLVPRLRSKTPKQAASPLGMTEDISYDWLANGGKRFRPFITLAAYDAMTGGHGAAAGNDHAELPRFPDGVCRAAMAIEAFHKASLVHDDIQDDDLFRYGKETLHRRYGVGPAINIGDYLIGMGYRLITVSREELGNDVAAEILDRMADAHLKLCDGQGAEMAWQQQPTSDFTPADALKIYALKTSPAFAAALFAGLRMAGSAEQYKATISSFCRELGVGFQILNDLKDWRGDDDNKLVKGQDAASLRPTLLLALAFQAADASQQTELDEIIATQGEADPRRTERLRRVFTACNVFEQAEDLINRSRQHAEELAESVEPQELRRLLHFLVETVLADEHRAKTPTGAR